MPDIDTIHGRLEADRRTIQHWQDVVALRASERDAQQNEADRYARMYHDSQREIETLRERISRLENYITERALRDWESHA